MAKAKQGLRKQRIDGGIETELYLWVRGFMADHSLTQSEILRTSLKMLKQEIDNGKNFTEIKAEFDESST